MHARFKYKVYLNEKENFDQILCAFKGPKGDKGDMGLTGLPVNR